MSTVNTRQRNLLASVAIYCLAACGILGCAAAQEGKPGSPNGFYALPVVQSAGSCTRTLYRAGVPFLATAWHRPKSDSTQVDVGAQVKRIYLLGMTEADGVAAWSNPKDYSQRFFVGDRLGQIVLTYDDGSTQVFPLILGESVWWGLPFYQYQEPFPTSAPLRDSLARSLRLYPSAPVPDGDYVAVIEPKATSLKSIKIVDSPEKKGGVVISAMTVQAPKTVVIRGASRILSGNEPADFKEFVRERALRPSGMDRVETEKRLHALKMALYTNDTVYAQPVATRVPQGSSGPAVVFRGSVYASILEDAFYANVQDMLAKVDPDGMYHTSTRGATSWNGAGFGTYRPNVGLYYGESWSRDMGRTMQELSELGYLDQTAHNADYSFRMAHLWSEDPALKYEGHTLPPHWSRIINRPDFAQPFENDGHGLISLSLYKLWQRQPDRDAWLRAHWADVKAAGDWIPWQFDHPRISGAKDGVLATTGESAGGNGYSVYADSVCMTALEALAQMADSIGKTQSASLWRDRAEKMRKAITARYIVQDTKYGRVWTLADAGWPNKSTVLGPLIFTADYSGFAPEDIYAPWKPVDEAAYRRIIDTYRPFGFYGWAMGYGQGFITQSALLLDRMQDATQMLDWAAKEIYDPRFGSFVVPEGVQVDPKGKFWYSAGDLGNGVQEAEIVKAIRLVIGVDDTEPARIQLFPRMPYDWKTIEVDNYPILLERNGKLRMTRLHYRLERDANGMHLRVSAHTDLGPVVMRLGPFKNQPRASAISVNGRVPANASLERSGDSWWVRLTYPIGSDLK